ncbi:hypothetical protein LCGC14_2019400 [marine sediment metagenome]|uniref:ArnR1-like winged helix-turn-helix domain-containing protein n=1 Tax=marine sediment metagenome TaxID=412755 RepID=A0A0F9HBA4_9ZZZZ
MESSHLFMSKRIYILERIAEEDIDTAAGIAKFHQVMYSHVLIVLDMFEEVGLITRDKIIGKREIKIILTEKGREAWQGIKRIKELIKDE